MRVDVLEKREELERISDAPAVRSHAGSDRSATDTDRIESWWPLSSEIRTTRRAPDENCSQCREQAGWVYNWCRF
jgi:hypothetical protein